MTDKPAEGLDDTGDGPAEHSEVVEPEHDDGSVTSDGGAAAKRATSPDDEAPRKAARRVSLSVRALIVGAVMVLLAAGLATMTWLYVGERADAQATAHAATDRQRAEQIALDYAVNAAAMNFQDLNAWKGQLVNGTSPELKGRLSKAADSMEQLLVPLQWTSTAKPLAAKVRSDTNGVYVVDTFVSVLTKTTQAPDNLQSTATYSITIDSNNDWLITDVGGIGAVVSGK
jgi:Mce-associated membrane protein